MWKGNSRLLKRKLCVEGQSQVPEQPEQEEEAFTEPAQG
jgi:hypothetical protein